MGINDFQSSLDFIIKLINRILEGTKNIILVHYLYYFVIITALSFSQADMINLHGKLPWHLTTCIVFIIMFLLLSMFSIGNRTMILSGILKTSRIELFTRRLMSAVFRGETKSCISIVFSRVTYGQCQGDSTVFTSFICNPHHDTGGIPTDSVLFAYLIPLCVQIIIKGKKV